MKKKFKGVFNLLAVFIFLSIAGVANAQQDATPEPVPGAADAECAAEVFGTDIVAAWNTGDAADLSDGEATLCISQFTADGARTPMDGSVTQDCDFSLDGRVFARISGAVPGTYWRIAPDLASTDTDGAREMSIECRWASGIPDGGLSSTFVGINASVPTSVNPPEGPSPR